MNGAQLAGILEDALREIASAPERIPSDALTLGIPLTSTAELGAHAMNLARGAHSTFDVFEPAPDALTHHWGDVSPLRCAGGVRVRVVRAHGLEGAGAQDSTQRVSELVTARLFIRDGTEAILASGAPEPAHAALRLTHPSAVGYLAAVFENVWEQALPLGEEGEFHGDEALLEQLLLGRTDAAIARALGVSVRTVQRRAHTLQRRLGVSSRFQLGLRVALSKQR